MKSDAIDTVDRYIAVGFFTIMAALALFASFTGESQAEYNGRCLAEGFSLESSGPDLICYDRTAYDGAGAYVRP